VNQPREETGFVLVAKLLLLASVFLAFAVVPLW
jgi:hypothetical protein